MAPTVILAGTLIADEVVDEPIFVSESKWLGFDEVAQRVREADEADGDDDLIDAPLGVAHAIELSLLIWLALALGLVYVLS